MVLANEGVSFDVSDIWAGGGEFGELNKWNISFHSIEITRSHNKNTNRHLPALEREG